MKKKVVIAGLGDTGILTAIHLASDFEVVGISPKPGLVSGQELGLRLTHPQRWMRDYLVAYERYEGLDDVETIHGAITAIDASSRQVEVRAADGSLSKISYDALVIATGVTSGFWREPALEIMEAIEDRVTATSGRVLAAESVAIVGAGASGVSVARSIAKKSGSRSVDLYFPQDRVLRGYHTKVRERATAMLSEAGVALHAGHRAELPADFERSQLTTGEVRWVTGQPPSQPDLTLWTIGRVTPNTDFMPDDMLTEDGFVCVAPTLQVVGHEGVFAIGDVAATDPQRSSARNWAYKILAHNVERYFTGEPDAMKHFEAPGVRWGSIFGPDDEDGLHVFFPNGRSMRVPAWLERNLLTPFITKRMIYKGIRPPDAS